MGCAAPKCPKSCQHQQKDAAAMGHALGTLHPPILPSSAGIRLFPRGTWRIQLARPPSQSTQGCSWQHSPLCQRVVLCKPLPQPPACHPAWVWREGHISATGHPWKQIQCLKDMDGVIPFSEFSISNSPGNPRITLPWRHWCLTARVQGVPLCPALGMLSYATAPTALPAPRPCKRPRGSDPQMRLGQTKPQPT